MKFSFSLSLLLVASAFADNFADEYCSEAVDRDVKIMIGFDGTSDCYWARYSLPYIADGLVEIDEWTTQSGHNLLVSKHRIGDGSRTGPYCTAGYVGDRTIADIHDDLTMTNVHYIGNRAPLTNAMIWNMHNKWHRSQLHSERRIYTVVTSHYPKLGTELLPVETDVNFEHFCPMTGKGTLEQAQDYIRGHGIGIFAYIWRAYATTSVLSQAEFENWLNEVGITDYYMSVRGGSGDMKNAKVHFLRGARTLICPSWIKSTTTYQPFAPSPAVEECLNAVGAEMGSGAVANETEFKTRLENCVY